MPRSDSARSPGPGRPRSSGDDGGPPPANEQFFTQAPALALPKGGGAIRGLGEKFAANSVTGTGSMTVPVATSPGRSGFGPQLSLSYDSGAGNGPFGLGWPHAGDVALLERTVRPGRAGGRRRAGTSQGAGHLVGRQVQRRKTGLGIDHTGNPAFHHVAPGAGAGGVGIENSPPAQHFVTFAGVLEVPPSETMNRLQSTLALQRPVSVRLHALQVR